MVQGVRAMCARAKKREGEGKGRERKGQKEDNRRERKSEGGKDGGRLFICGVLIHVLVQ